MKYCVDRVEGEIAILENLTTREIIEININQLPTDIKETNILYYIDGTYKIDIVEENVRKNNIQRKFDKLRKK